MKTLLELNSLGFVIVLKGAEPIEVLEEEGDFVRYDNCCNAAVFQNLPEVLKAQKILIDRHNASSEIAILEISTRISSYHT